MKTTLLWSGREYNSLEHCTVNVTAGGAEVQSTIVGYYQQTIYKVNYTICTNAAWQTLGVAVRWQQNGTEHQLQLESDDRGHWKRDGQPEDAFTGCIDVDLPLTPFTNTLPINRLRLTEGAETEIRVLYLDLLACEFKPVRQKYKRLSHAIYHYENVPNDFEADITVDQHGLIVDYPRLFVRMAAE